MEDIGTSEEDDIDSQDSNIPIDHGHLAQNCSIKMLLSVMITSSSQCPEFYLVFHHLSGQFYYFVV